MIILLQTSSDKSAPHEKNNNKRTVKFLKFTDITYFAFHSPRGCSTRHVTSRSCSCTRDRWHCTVMATISLSFMTAIIGLSASNCFCAVKSQHTPASKCKAAWKVIFSLLEPFLFAWCGLNCHATSLAAAAAQWSVTSSLAIDLECKVDAQQEVVTFGVKVVFSRL